MTIHYWFVVTVSHDIEAIEKLTFQTFISNINLKKKTHNINIFKPPVGKNKQTKTWGWAGNNMRCGFGVSRSHDMEAAENVIFLLVIRCIQICNKTVYNFQTWKVMEKQNAQIRNNSKAVWILGPWVTLYRRY